MRYGYYLDTTSMVRYDWYNHKAVYTRFRACIEGTVKVSLVIL